MLKTILQASENFCIHQIRLPYEVSEGVSQKRTLIAYIDIEANDSKKFRVYVASEESLIQKVAMLFLEEEQSDEETLMDMLLETTNLIVGSAKVIAEESNDNPFTITTPNFLKIDKFDFEYDKSNIITIEDSEMIIAIKELNE